MKENKKNIAIEIICWVILAVMYFGIYLKASVTEMVSDFYFHNIFAKLVCEGNMEIMYPGYHLLVGGLWKITGIDTTYTSVLVLIVASLFSIYITEKIIREINPELERIYVFYSAIIVNIIQPVFTSNIRPGYSSGNGYISPTQILCKPFILWTILVFYRIYKNKDWSFKNQTTLTIALIITCFIKPMFAMAFVPAIGLMFLVDRRKDKDIKEYIVEVMPLFLTGLVLVGQFIYMKNITVKTTGMPIGGTDPDSHIKFGFMYAWRMCVKSVSLSIIFAYLAPITTLIVAIKNKISLNINQKIFFKISCYYFVISFIYISCLYQTKYEGDLNFRNGWIISFLLMHILNISVIISEVKHNDKKNMNLPIISEIIQIVFGIMLVVRNIFF